MSESENSSKLPQVPAAEAANGISGPGAASSGRAGDSATNDDRATVNSAGYSAQEVTSSAQDEDDASSSSTSSSSSDDQEVPSSPLRGATRQRVRTTSLSDSDSDDDVTPHEDDDEDRHGVQGDYDRHEDDVGSDIDDYFMRSSANVNGPWPDGAESLPRLRSILDDFFPRPSESWLNYCFRSNANLTTMLDFIVRPTDPAEGPVPENERDSPTAEEEAAMSHPGGQGGSQSPSTPGGLGIVLPRAEHHPEGLGADEEDKVAMRRSYRLMNLLTSSATLVVQLTEERSKAMTKSLLRIFSPHSRGSFHHACTVLQSLVLSQPMSVAEALMEGDRRLLWPMLRFLHHPPVADTLLQLITLNHKETAAGGAGANAGAMSFGGGMFGGAPQEGDLGSLYARRSFPPPINSQQRLFSFLGETGFIRELTRHIYRYAAIPDAGWGAQSAAESSDTEDTAAAAAAKDRSRLGGSEADSSIEPDALEENARAAHVTIAAETVTQLIRVVRSEGHGALQLVKPLMGDQEGMEGLVRTCASTDAAPAARQAAMQTLADLAELVFEESIPGDPNAAGGMGGISAMMPGAQSEQPNALYRLAPVLAANLLRHLPRLVSCLTHLHESLHPNLSSRLFSDTEWFPKGEGGPFGGGSSDPPPSGEEALVVMSGESAVQYPGHAVRVPFGNFRLNAVRLICAIVDRAEKGALDRMAGEDAAKEAETLNPPPVPPPATLGGWEGPGIWAALVSWVLEYPHNSIFHSLFKRLLRSALVHDHRTTLWSILYGSHFVELLLMHYVAGAPPVSEVRQLGAPRRGRDDSHAEGDEEGDEEDEGAEGDDDEAESGGDARSDKQELLYDADRAARALQLSLRWEALEPSATKDAHAVDADPARRRQALCRSMVTGPALEFLNMIRLARVTSEPNSLLCQYLQGCTPWRRFLPFLRNDTAFLRKPLAPRPRQMVFMNFLDDTVPPHDESDEYKYGIDLGSKYAEELGFAGRTVHPETPDDETFALSATTAAHGVASGEEATAPGNSPAAASSGSKKRKKNKRKRPKRPKQKQGQDTAGDASGGSTGGQGGGAQPLCMDEVD